MTDHAHPGADAAVSAPVPQAFVPYTDETYDLRKQAAQTMLSYLEKSEAMLARCEIVMRDKGSNQFVAANAAVRIMKAGGDITKALMLATFGETRHRSLRDEAILPPRPQRANSDIAQDLNATQAVLARELRALTEECADGWQQGRATDIQAHIDYYGRPPGYVRAEE
jgi:hypothetical protein